MSLRRELQRLERKRSLPFHHAPIWPVLRRSQLTLDFHSDEHPVCLERFCPPPLDGARSLFRFRRYRSPLLRRRRRAGRALLLRRPFLCTLRPDPSLFLLRSFVILSAYSRVGRLSQSIWRSWWRGSVRRASARVIEREFRRGSRGVRRQEGLGRCQQHKLWDERRRR
jgi:hypothetical protein